MLWSWQAVLALSVGQRKSVPWTEECGSEATEQSRGSEHLHCDTLDENNCQTSKAFCGPILPWIVDNLDMIVSWWHNTWLTQITSAIAIGFPGPSWNIGPLRWFLSTAITSQADFRNHALPWLLYSLPYPSNPIFLFSPLHKLWAEGLPIFLPSLGFASCLEEGLWLCPSLSSRQVGTAPAKSSSCFLWSSSYLLMAFSFVLSPRGAVYGTALSSDPSTVFASFERSHTSWFSLSHV